MATLSTYIQQALLNAVLRNTTYTSPATVYIALFSVAPTMPAGTGGTELTSGTAGGYARQAVTFGAPGASGSGQQVANTGTPTFTDNASPFNWPNVVAWGVYDALTGGNLLASDTLAGTNDVQTVSTTAQLTAGTYTLNPNGTTSVAIPYNATAATIEELLEAACGEGNITAAFSGNRFDQATPGTLVLTFGGTLRWASQTLMTLTPTGITGGTLSIAHTTPGGVGSQQPTTTGSQIQFAAAALTASLT